MAVTLIETKLGDTALGSPAAYDGIAMLCVPGEVTTGTGGLAIALNTPYLVSSMKDITSMGATVSNNPDLIEQANLFYAKAGNGSRLWFVVYTKTVEGYKAFLDTYLEDMVQATVVTDFNLRPRLIGFCGSRDFVTDTTTSDPLVPAIVTAAIPKFQTHLNNLFQDSFRCVGVIDGINLNCKTASGILGEQIATTLPDCAALNAPRVGVQITGSTSTSTAAVGEVLGIMAANTVATSIGSMILGSAAPIEYFVDTYDGNYIGTPVGKVNRSKCEEIGGKQYIFTRTRPQCSGVYYNDGATCNDPTMALSSLEFVRVGNKVCDMAEAFFVLLLNTNIPTDANGEIDAGYKASTLADLDARYLAPMVRRGDAQTISVDFKAKDGNFIQSRAIEVTIQILPNASLREVYIETFFVSSLS